jgi:polyisoprenoid-binding protein YceI
MKNIIGKVLIVLIAAYGFTWANTYTIDTQKSVMKWVGKKVVGGHDGIVKIKQGTVVTKGTEVSGTIVIDMNTIENSDIENATYRAKLEGHLKNPDFFDVEKYPTSTFVITQAKEVSKGTYSLTGNLTIKDKTHPVTFSATVSEIDKTTMLKASFSIDRTKWGVVYNSKGFFDVKALGDKLILDDIKFELDIVLVAQ